MRAVIAAVAAALALGLTAAPAAADEPTPEPPVVTEPVPTPEPEPEPTEPVVEEPVEPTPVEPVPPVDIRQPPSWVPVLPRRCVGTGQMPVNGSKPCRVLRYGKRSPLVVVWGDSHSWQQTRGIIAAARSTRSSLVTFQMGACPPMLLTAAESSNACADVGPRALRFIERRVDRGRKVTVVLGAYWQGYRSLANHPDLTHPEAAYLNQQADRFAVGGPRVFRALARLRVRTVGIGQQPVLGFGEALPLNDPARSAVLPAEASVRAWLAKRVDRLVEPSRVLCGPLVCAAERGGLGTYADSLHLNPAISDRLAPLYRRVLR